MLTASAQTPSLDQPPRWDLPSGPLWLLDAPGEAPPALVWRHPWSGGLLKVGMALRHAASTHHPQLAAPQRWWKQDDFLYLSAPYPGGEPLAALGQDRLTFGAAVDALTPMALALKSAHRRGTFHGALSPARVFFDPATSRLSAVGTGEWVVQHTGDRQPSPLADIESLARVLLRLTMPADEARAARPNFETIPSFAIGILERAISPDPARRPQSIDELLAGLRFRSSEGLDAPAFTPLENDAPVSIIGGVVRGLDHFEHPRQGPGLRFTLDHGESGSVGVFFYARHHSEVYTSARNLWEGARLNLIDAAPVADSRGRRFLTAGPDTLPVVEPQWPVSVSDVLKAQGCPQRVLVDARDPGELTHHLAFGNLIHGMLEDLTGAEALDFDTSLARRLPGLRLDLLAAGVDDATLASLEVHAREHFDNIRRLTAPRTRQLGDEPTATRVGWSGRHVEATRFSSRYGLEGRIDLVVESPQEGVQIIELKSGKPWDDHIGQVRSYALLWEELARAEGLPMTGHLLYSRDGTMRQTSLDDIERERRILRARNDLVAHYRAQVDPAFDYRAPYYMEEPALCRQGDCRFRRDRCKMQSELLGLAPQPDYGVLSWPHTDPQLVRQARAYHAHMSRLVTMERWSDHAALGAIFEPQRLSERVEAGLCAPELHLEAVEGHPERARLRGKHLQIFSPGDSLLIHRGDIDASHILRGRCLSVDGDTLELRLRGAHFPDALAGPGYIADQPPARLGYRSAHQALYRVLRSQRDELLQVLVRPQTPGAAPLMTGAERRPSLHPATLDQLNAPQRQAIEAAISAPLGALIQGPPGTGKTTVIAHLTLEFAERDQRVLLAALTHTAVDTMLIKLLEAGDLRGRPPRFLRVGSASRSPAVVRALEARGLHPADYFADDLAAAHASLNRLGSRAEEPPIIATTTHSALRAPLIAFLERRLGKPAFDVTIVDEASQLTEPLALGPISLARRFVLVGDHAQLPPIVSSERALSSFIASEKSPFELSDTLRQAGLAGLDRSLFERLATAGLPVHMLQVQYRMNRAIMSFPAETFYQGKLSAAPQVEDRRMPAGPYRLDALTTDAPVSFVDVRGVENARTNLAEAHALLALLGELATHAPELSVGVISPFRAQVHLLRSLLASAELPPTEHSIDIDTVERFQGSERDVIIASLVKSERPGDFLSDPRRLNVTLTRARKKLIIVGHSGCLRQDPLFRPWLEHPQTTWHPWTHL
ncbi:hypothetical protein DL240_01055 [Lujinxingia litoralis]|uniref:AAA+ ATPase domain-containing protein n=1 Tax=Lujinxingia litoralis TaxID=2211119 RepID=A0A328CBA6_9DELT|nr:PLuB system helicase-like protein [Lujinxingia litoralis]RAL24830.1 hypothetical protein DL240_01055 [Lujinxingia litoralis]